MTFENAILIFDPMKVNIPKAGFRVMASPKLSEKYQTNWILPEEDKFVENGQSYVPLDLHVMF